MILRLLVSGSSSDRSPRAVEGSKSNIKLTALYDLVPESGRACVSPPEDCKVWTKRSSIKPKA